MCKALEDMRNEALETGRIKGRIEGYARGYTKEYAEGYAEGYAKEYAKGYIEVRLLSLTESVRNLKEKLGFTDQQAKDALNISNEEWESIAVKV